LVSTCSFFQLRVRPIPAAERIKTEAAVFWAKNPDLVLPPDLKRHEDTESNPLPTSARVAAAPTPQAELERRIETFFEVQHRGLLRRMAFLPTLGLVQRGLLTNSFLEFDLSRLLVFLLLLYFVGPLLEEAVGGLPFLTLLVAGSTTAVVTQTAFSGSGAPIYGYDGMTAAMMGALMLHFALEAVELGVIGWFLIWSKRGAIRLPAALIALTWAVLETVTYLRTEVSRAHILGQLAGFAFGFVGAALVKLVHADAVHEAEAHPATDVRAAPVAQRPAETPSQAPVLASPQIAPQGVPEAPPPAPVVSEPPPAATAEATAQPPVASPAPVETAAEATSTPVPSPTPLSIGARLSMSIPVVVRPPEVAMTAPTEELESEDHVPTPMSLAEEVSLAEAELKAEDPVGLQRAERLLTQQLGRNHRDDLLQVLTLCTRLNPLDLLPVTAFRLATELEECPPPLRGHAERYYAAAGKHPNAMAARALVRASELHLEVDPDRGGIEGYLADLSKLTLVPPDLMGRIKALRGEPTQSIEIPISTVEPGNLSSSLARRFPSILEHPVATTPQSSTEPKIVRGRLLEVTDQSLRVESENGTQHTLSLKNVVAVGVGMMPRPTLENPQRSVVVTDLVVVPAEGDTGPGVVRLESTGLRLPVLYPGVRPSEAYRRFLAHVMIQSGANPLGEMEGVFQGRFPRFADEGALNASLYAPATGPIQPVN
jgi:membrane associated rhomboid family serine protease